MPLSEFMERMGAQDMVLLREAHYIRSIDDLVRDLGQVGDPPDHVVQWLGHPIHEITAEEEATLRAYLVTAQEAIREKKPTPYLPPNTPLRDGSGTG